MGKVYIDEQSILRCCQELVDEYVKKEDYEYSMECEFSNKLDSESSLLSKMIFCRLLASDADIISDVFTATIAINGIKVSFDIMNNSNSSDKDFYRLGSIAKRKEAKNLARWEKLKYTIGNFVPIPNGKKRHIQLIHNNENERWDFLLKYCEEHWEDYSCDLYPTFRDYMIKTVQHVYIREVLEDLISKLNGRQIEDVKENEFEKWIENWDSILIDKSKACELISFGEKTTNMDNIEDVIELICLLIKTRGRMIISLLKQKNP